MVMSKRVLINCIILMIVWEFRDATFPDTVSFAILTHANMTEDLFIICSVKTIHLYE